MINIFLSEELIHSLITIMKDNQSGIKITHNLKDHKKIRHIDIRYHFIRQFVNNRKIEFQWIHLSDQLADILIKSLSITGHTRFMDGIGFTNKLSTVEEPDASI
jgi:hypothetical protein